MTLIIPKYVLIFLPPPVVTFACLCPSRTLAMVRVEGKVDGREDPEAPKTSHAEHLPGRHRGSHLRRFTLTVRTNPTHSLT